MIDEDEDDLGELLTERGRRSGSRRVDHRPSPRRALPKLLALLVVVAALLGGGIYGVGKVVGRIGGEPAADYPGSGEGIEIVEVPEGATATDIARLLAEADVVASAQAFINVAMADERALSIQPGTYRLRSKMSAAAALEAMLDPASSALFKFTITPGDSVRDVFSALSERTGTPMEELQKYADDPSQLGVPEYATTLEGYLFPSTYNLGPGTEPVEVLKEAVARFKETAKKINLEERAAASNLTPSEVVIIASIIQQEVANEDEGPKVARVIYNRLNDTSGRFRRLDMDSTTRYALNEYEGPLTREQLEHQNPYNTRAVPGLPPGAISNPSVWALESALSPEPGPWFFFVSLPQSKRTVFAATQEEFNRALQQYYREGGTE